MKRVVSPADRKWSDKLVSTPETISTRSRRLYKSTVLVLQESLKPYSRPISNSAAAPATLRKLIPVALPGRNFSVSYFRGYVKGLESLRVEDECTTKFSFEVSSIQCLVGFSSPTVVLYGNAKVCEESVIWKLRLQMNVYSTVRYSSRACRGPT